MAEETTGGVNYGLLGPHSGTQFKPTSMKDVEQYLRDTRELKRTKAKEKAMALAVDKAGNFSPDAARKSLFADGFGEDADKVISEISSRRLGDIDKNYDLQRKMFLDVQAGLISPEYYKKYFNTSVEKVGEVVDNDRTDIRVNPETFEPMSDKVGEYKLPAPAADIKLGDIPLTAQTPKMRSVYEDRPAQAAQPYASDMFKDVQSPISENKPTFSTNFVFPSVNKEATESAAKYELGLENLTGSDAEKQKVISEKIVESVLRRNPEPKLIAYKGDYSAYQGALRDWVSSVEKDISQKRKDIEAGGRTFQGETRAQAGEQRAQTAEQRAKAGESRTVEDFKLAKAGTKASENDMLSGDVTDQAARIKAEELTNAYITLRSKVPSVLKGDIATVIDFAKDASKITNADNTLEGARTFLARLYGPEIGLAFADEYSRIKNMDASYSVPSAFRNFLDKTPLVRKTNPNKDEVTKILFEVAEKAKSAKGLGPAIGKDEDLDFYFENKKAASRKNKTAEQALKEKGVGVKKTDTPTPVKRKDPLNLGL